MSPLEKAARALHDAGNWQVAENLRPHPPFEELSWVERGWLFTQARAVIQSMIDTSESPHAVDELRRVLEDGE